jgi:erythromycin esterase
MRRMLPVWLILVVLTARLLGSAGSTAASETKPTNESTAPLRATWLASAQRPSRPATEMQPIQPDGPLEREMAGADVHIYSIRLTTGQFLRTRVDQRGIDVVVTAYGPDGRKLAEVDAEGTQGPERMSLVARASGIYRLEIRPFEPSASAGRYQVKIEELLSPSQYAARLALQRAQLKAASGWLTRNAIRLNAVEAGHGFKDMQPLKRLIGRARLVALGEATHGTREFFQLKHRMLEFLVNEMGFTVFAIEATMPEAFDVNEYVLTGRGDPAKALAGLYFWTWNTEEVREMIRWMRRYNADPRHHKKVKFYGFDMQWPPRAAKVVLSYLREVDPEQATAAEKILAAVANPFTFWDYLMLSEERKQAAAALMNSLLRRFDERRKAYSQRSSPDRWALARQHARILVQYLQAHSGDYGSERDRSMADNIRWTLEREGPGAKMVVWAHNAHVSTKPPRMGSHLRKALGRDMVVFGFAYNRGSFQQGVAGVVRSFNVGPAREGSIDATLAGAGLSIAAVDLRTLPRNGPVAAWFSAPHGMRFFEFYSEDVVSRLYDALLFVNKTTAARTLATFRGHPRQQLAAPMNLGFESGSLGKPPPDWDVQTWLENFGFQVVTSNESPQSGERCALVRRVPGRQYGERFGGLQQTIDAAPYHGKQIRLRAAVRTDVEGTGNQAYLWLRVLKQGSGPAATPFLENMADRPITHREWRQYEIVGEVPMEAEKVEYGLALVGSGRAWLDSVSIEVVER